MYKLFFIAKNNMKKQRGDMITFFILTLISAFLIFDCVSAFFGLGKIFDERFEKVNGASVMFLVGATDEEKECVEKAFTDNKYITQYETSPAINFAADYKKKGDSEYSNYSFIVESFDEEPEIMNMGIDQAELGDDDILLPRLLKGKYVEGDTIQFKIDKDVYDFNVAGFAENPYLCCSTNITIYNCFISSDKMDELSTDHPKTVYKNIFATGIAKTEDFDKDYTTRDLEHEISDSYKELITPYNEKNPEGNYFGYLAMNWDMMRGGNEFTPLIFMGILLMFAIIILLIAVVIISFSIKNFIQRNMKNTGILEASGYTVKELRASLTVQLLLVAALGSIVGLIIAALTFEGFGNVLSSVCGLSWNQPLNIMAFAITFVGIVLLVYFVSRLVSRAYKKITVLDSLRGGISTHNYKKNLFSFENTPLPISIVLSLKDTFGGLGRNIIVVLITAMLAISALIGFGIYENFARDKDKLISFMGFEMGDIYVDGDDKMGDDLREIDGVENVLGFVGIEPTVYHGDEKTTVYTYVYDDANNGMKTRMVEGRIPEKDNEILITGAAADDLGVKVGDVVDIEMGSKKAEYLIVGINQRVERMGRTIIMSESAAERILPEIKSYSYYITMEDGVSYETMENRLKDYAENEGLEFEDLQCTNMGKSMDETLGSITAAMKSVCVIIAILTSIIVIFVESLVVRAKITREWKGMGISKALGQTSGGLISQIILSNAPAIISGVILGIIISKPVGAKLCITTFSLFGMKSIDFNLPFIWIAITLVVVLASAFLTSGILGLKVRTLKPVEMITEE